MAGKKDNGPNPFDKPHKLFVAYKYAMQLSWNLPFDAKQQIWLELRLQDEDIRARKIWSPATRRQLEWVLDTIDIDW